jgi:hypothetical protein
MHAEPGGYYFLHCIAQAFSATAIFCFLTEMKGQQASRQPLRAHFQPLRLSEPHHWDSRMSRQITLSCIVFSEMPFRALSAAEAILQPATDITPDADSHLRRHAILITPRIT